MVKGGSPPPRDRMGQKSMTRSWRNARVGTRVLIGLMVPTLVAIVLLVNQVNTKRHAVGDADAATDTIQLTAAIGDVLHETQRERGRSSQFLTSKGTKFGDELKAQRSKTDAQATRLNSLGTRL